MEFSTGVDLVDELNTQSHRVKRRESSERCCSGAEYLLEISCANPSR